MICRSRCTLALVLVVVAAAVVPATAEDGIVFRLNATDAATYPFRITQDQTTIIEMGPMGSQEITGKTAFHGRFTISPRDGGGLRMETVYDRFTMRMNQMGAETVLDSDDQSDSAEAQVLNGMIGKPVMVEFDATGRVVSVDGFAAMMDDSMPELDEAGPQGMQLKGMLEQAFNDDTMVAMMQQSQTIYPDKALSPGESWTSQFDLSNAALGEMAVSTDYTLVEVGSIGNRETARVDLTMKMTFGESIPMLEQLNSMFAAQGGSLAIEIGDSTASGSMLIDLASGLTLESTMDQDVAMKMDLSIGGQEMEMKMVVDSVMRTQFFELAD